MSEVKRTPEQKELDDLLEKLEQIKKDNGIVDKGEANKNAGDNFMENKAKVIERYKTIKGIIKQREDLQKSGKDPKQVVVMSSRIRSELGLLKTEFEGLSKVLIEESKKKKSKFTPEEMETRREVVADLAGKVEELVNASRSSNGPSGPGNFSGFAPISSFTPSISQFTAMEDEETKFGGPSGGGRLGGGGPRTVRETEMSAIEKQGLAQIEANKLEEDKILDLIGNNVKDLKALAEGMNEEVNKQKIMLEDIDGKMEKVTGKMETTLSNLKRTAAENNRGGDKICMDMICFVLILGVLTVIYNMVKKSTG